jgi:hypothetical protein
LLSSCKLKSVFFLFLSNSTWLLLSSFDLSFVELYTRLPRVGESLVSLLESDYKGFFFKLKLCIFLNSFISFEFYSYVNFSFASISLDANWFFYSCYSCQWIFNFVKLLSANNFFFYSNLFITFVVISNYYDFLCLGLNSFCVYSIFLFANIYWTYSSLFL